MKMLEDLKIKIFADGSDVVVMLDAAGNPLIKGFTTNPSLMRHANVVDYEEFAKAVIPWIPNLPISFEVVSDGFDEMERQARLISSWGENVYVKIPITNTEGKRSDGLICGLAKRGVKQNVTAVFNCDQFYQAAEALADGPPSFISIFAGRIADTGRDPLPVVQSCVTAINYVKRFSNIELIWASTRQIYDIFLADQVGCHIITVTNDLIKKFPLVGKDLDEFSLETVQQFYSDAIKAGFSL